MSERDITGGQKRASRHMTKYLIKKKHLQRNYRMWYTHSTAVAYNKTNIKKIKYEKRNV